MREQTAAMPEPSRDERIQQLREIMDRLDHVLPGQAPLLNFVHHNTLHGFQHLDFEQALQTAEAVNGIRAYLPDAHYRRCYAAGRIDADDVRHALEQRTELRVREPVLMIADRVVSRGDVLATGLIRGIESLPPSRLAWSIDAEDVLRRFRSDVPGPVRQRLLQQSPGAGEADVVRALWSACVETLDCDESALHPEEMLDLSPALAEQLWVALGRREQREVGDDLFAHRRMLADIAESVTGCVAAVGTTMTLRELLQRYTGCDVLEEVRPLLIRLCGAYLDEGLASWPLPDRADGFYAAWRRLAAADPTYALNDVAAEEVVANLPASAEEAIVRLLEQLGLPPGRWQGYLERLALELPGWSGMFNWRYRNAKYAANATVKVDLADYLAVRLVLERLWGAKHCQRLWGIAFSLPAIERYLSSHLAETCVRFHLYGDPLPEYLAERARAVVEAALDGRSDTATWRHLADMIFAWRRSQGAGSGRHTLHESAWRLFLLAQHLGLSAKDLRNAPRDRLQALLEVLDELTPALRGALWTVAYEHHYQEELVNGLASNHGRGLWSRRDRRPEAQIVYCIDEREESVRRHVEELNPNIETFGAAGFFGVVMNWRGLDDQKVTPLCPIVATPSHEVREVARPEDDAALESHRHGLARWTRLRSIYRATRRNLLSAHMLIDLLAPVALFNLIAIVLFPVRQYRIVHQLRDCVVRKIATRVAITAEGDSAPASPERPRLGFTDDEQADRVAALLRSIGLTDGFARLVVLMAHGSVSLNNPHEAAHDCGACSGRHGGPNARSFAAMANRPAVRTLLAARGVVIPADTWFVGAQHNTCDDSVSWYDVADIPEPLRGDFAKLAGELRIASEMSAQERCRRFASAPLSISPKRALRHVIRRAHSYAQVRPEFGHATNAAAIVGRRSMSHGLFLDRRAFLVSYDPTRDPDGKILEGILLAVGPVGAGINLEYYFSTVDNQRFGCGTKVPHNVTGLFGVMEGTSSDLRTGLPLQMVEIHEPMRLQVVVESTPEILTAIYARQAPLRELVGNRWVYLIAKDPGSDRFWIFDPERGFASWEGIRHPLPWAASSSAYYRDRRDFLAPALIGGTPSARGQTT